MPTSCLRVLWHGRQKFIHSLMNSSMVRLLFSVKRSQRGSELSVPVLSFLFLKENENESPPT